MFSQYLTFEKPRGNLAAKYVKGNCATCAKANK